MEIDIPNIIAKKYKELITYISQIGNYAEYHWDPDRVIIKVQNNDKKVILWVKLHQSPYVSNPEQEYLEVYWRRPDVCNYSAPHLFHESTDQKIMFNILLFEMLNNRLQNMDYDVNDYIQNAVNRALSSEKITNWLKTKEEQIIMEERAKIENHLSIEEFRKVVNEELGKVSINLKIGDK